jgi:hypothetical protein
MREYPPSLSLEGYFYSICPNKNEEEKLLWFGRFPKVWHDLSPGLPIYPHQLMSWRIQ